MTPRVLAAPDKFKGSASAAEVAAAMSAAAETVGATCVRLPLADGGDGTLDALGGQNRVSLVTGPLGSPVAAGWRLGEGLAVIEMARASGLLVAGGEKGNDAVAATSRGTGELILEAFSAGAETVIVGVGGSATTDGGAGAVEVLRSLAPFGVGGNRIRVACDVRTRFVDAARVFGPQKGAGPSDVARLEARLIELVAFYRSEFGVDVANLEGGGAAGGLAGGLAALGAELEPGFDLVANALGLDSALGSVDLVLTGEGRLDETSFDGKVVGGVVTRAAVVGLPVVVIAAVISETVRGRVRAVSIADECGAANAWRDTTGCIEHAALHVLDAFTLEADGI